MRGSIVVLPADSTPTDTILAGRMSVSGSVFSDVDGDGSLSAGEAGLGGWTVVAFGPVTLTTTTDGNGAYSFTGLVPGSYLVCAMPPAGWTQTVILFAPSCGSNLFGYQLDAPNSADDTAYSGGFRIHSQLISSLPLGMGPVLSAGPIYFAATRPPLPPVEVYNL